MQLNIFGKIFNNNISNCFNVNLLIWSAHIRLHWKKNKKSNVFQIIQYFIEYQWLFFFDKFVTFCFLNISNSTKVVTYSRYNLFIGMFVYIMCFEFKFVIYYNNVTVYYCIIRHLCTHLKTKNNQQLYIYCVTYIT